MTRSDRHAKDSRSGTRADEVRCHLLQSTIGGQFQSRADRRIVLKIVAHRGIDRQIRSHSGTRHFAAVGAVKLGRRQSQTSGSGLEGKQCLHRSLAVGTFAHDDTSSILLNGRRENFAGTGAVPIDQDHQRHSPGLTVVRHFASIVGRVASLGRHDRPCWQRALKGELQFLVQAHQAHDILTAIRLGKEFGLKMVLEGCAEAYLVMDQIKASGYPVILHPTMQRAGGDTGNISRETAAKLRAAGIPFAIESGFEGYVPKNRVVLFEAGMAAANGLSFDNALASITIDSARILGVADRVGSLEAGKDGDVAMYDGDPFELTTHCVGVISDGKIVSEEKR